MTRPKILLALAVAVVSVLATAAAAQTSSGRHRVERAPEPVEDARHDHGAVRFFGTVGAGLATSGDLFRLRAADVSGIPWAPGSGVRFQSQNVMITLDEDLVFAVGAGLRVGTSLWVRLDGSHTALDMAAQAKVGQGVDIYRWDKLSFTLVTASAEYRLTRERSFPYVLGGGGLAFVTGEFEGQFDQTRPVFRLGAGWQQALIDRFSLRAEVRDAITDLAFDAYQPPIEGTVIPDYEIEESGATHVFELLLMFQGEF